MRLPVLRRSAKRVRRVSWPVAAVQAVVAAALVCLAVWYAVGYPEELDGRFAAMGPSRVGLITVAVMLLAGGLLAFAFSRAEDAVRELRARATHMAEADD